MNILIDSGGWLQIERAGKWKVQRCPFAGADDQGRWVADCGDWCPHFGEVRLLSDVATDRLLDLCHGKTLMGDITDQRKAYV